MPRSLKKEKNYLILNLIKSNSFEALLSTNTKIAWIGNWNSCLSIHYHDKFAWHSLKIAL